jgi:ACR3 family arsenite efflux pump ArsB
VNQFIRVVVSRYADVLWVLLAAAVGLTIPEPGRVATRHDAVNIVLVVLVFAAALTVPQRAGARCRQHGLRIVGVTLASSATVVGLAWLVAHLVEAGPLRFGVLAVGVAPVEVATLGIAPRGGGDPLSSGVMLIGSTVLSALFAAPLMALLAGDATVQVGNLVRTLLLVVVLPFGVGLAARAHVGPGLRRRVSPLAAAAVTVLVWLVASQAHLSDAYLGVVMALALLILASATIGSVLARLVDRRTGRSLVFATSMRDFAIASGIAAAAFGAAAAAPLGLYGIMVMLWGTALAGTLRLLQASAESTQDR